MSGTIELPVWVVVLGTAFAVIALVDRIVGPSLRWMLRKRVKRAIERLNERLDLRIQDFKLIKREVLIDRLTHDPAVIQALEVERAATGKPVDVLSREVERYAREIVPSFSAYLYFSVGTRISRWISRMLYRVRVAPFDPRLLKRLDDKTSVVFVMNHRSNADYLLATYLAQQTSALSYAVGEWARVWPLSRIIRAMGAYFIRRKSRNALYRRVLSRYIQMAIEAGVTQAIFPEGGLSRDGSLGPAKLGLLSYIVSGFDPEAGRDVVFVPVGVNYDRVLEDRILLSAETDAQGRPRFRASILTSAMFILKLVWRRCTGRYHRFGYACVSFGEPLSLRAFQASSKSDDAVKTLGLKLMRRIGSSVPIAPVPLVCAILVEADNRPMPRETILSEAKRRLAASRAPRHVPHSDPSYMVEFALRILLKRKLAVETADGVTLRQAEDRKSVV